MTQLYEDKQPTLNWEERGSGNAIAHTPYGFYAIMPLPPKGEQFLLDITGALEHLPLSDVSTDGVIGTRDFLMKIANEHYKAFGELRFKPVQQQNGESK